MSSKNDILSAIRRHTGKRYRLTLWGKWVW